MSIPLKPLEEQVIVITGASSGIGLATALTAAKRGAKVVLTARSEGTLAQVAERILREGGDAIAVSADVALRASVQKVADAAFQRYGRIDTWVNDAGVSIYGKLEEVTEQDSRRLFDTNFWGVVNGSLVALPYLKANGGALINVGSEVSDATVPYQGMYCASKHAVKSFTQALRIEVEELERAPVAITLIQPTAVNTPYPQHARNYMDREPKLPNSQIDPQQVADAIVDAAGHRRRDVRVGAGAVVNTIVAKIAPAALADKLFARQAARQQRAEPPRNPAGALHRAGIGGQIRGLDG